MVNEILQGDVREVVKTLADNSVHCIVTSSPYWGLRDYGTAEWEGGKEECDHVEISRLHPIHSDSTSTLGIPSDGGKRRIKENNAGNEARKQQYKSTCAKCGAIRIDAQIGLEDTPEEYVATMVEIFRELRRVLREDGTLWLNLGSSYAANRGYQVPDNKHIDVGNNHSLKCPSTYKPKDLIPIPWLVALALQADGWYLRSDIIWSKPNPMPESVTDRPTKAHEYILLLTKSPRYYYDQEAIREKGSGRTPGNKNYKYDGIQGHETKQGILAQSNIPQINRNKRTVWSIATQPYAGAHFATFPPKLIEPCILAGCPSKVCVECGSPWVRVVEKIKAPPDVFTETAKPKDGFVSVNVSGKGMGQKYQTWRNNNPPQTIAFKPTCQCNAPTKSGIVLDPFFGAGTVAIVAVQHLRNWLGIELNPEYIKLAMERIRKTQPALFAY